ncbi:MAG: pentapeptide repeat-containing protein [Pirellula sp.]
MTLLAELSPNELSRAERDSGLARASSASVGLERFLGRLPTIPLRFHRRCGLGSSRCRYISRCRLSRLSSRCGLSRCRLSRCRLSRCRLSRCRLSRCRLSSRWQCGQPAWGKTTGIREREIWKSRDLGKPRGSSRRHCCIAAFTVPSKKRFRFAAFEPSQPSLGLGHQILGNAFRAQSFVLKDRVFALSKSFESLGQPKQSSPFGERFLSGLGCRSVVIYGLFEVLIGYRSIDVPFLQGLGHVGIPGGEFGPGPGAGVGEIASDCLEVLRGCIGEVKIGPTPRCSSFLLAGVNPVTEQPQNHRTGDA